jgi:hypothetical protein
MIVLQHLFTYYRPAILPGESRAGQSDIGGGEVKRQGAYILPKPANNQPNLQVIFPNQLADSSKVCLAYKSM